ncbi:MAG: cytochrome-c peroxidase, partial [Gammaproteobacteria bacterium]
MYNRTKSNVCLLLAMGLSLAACSSDTETSADQLRKIVNDLNLSGDPADGRVLPDISDPKAQLGMKVFFSKILSAAGDSTMRMDSACVSCHHPMLGGGDDLPLPIGVQAEAADLLGPGRFHSLVHVMDDNGGAGGGEYDGGPTVPRNAPTTVNIALWDQVLFHDGRVESLGKTAGANGDDGSGIRTPDSALGVADPNSGANLVAAQARFPVTSPEEMKGFNGTTALTGTNDDVRLDISATMDVTNWDAEFDAVYGGTDGVAGTVVGNPYARIAEVIGEYERSQVFVDTPWKAF